MNTLPITRSRDYDRNIDRFGDYSNSCVICGRPTKEEFHIHATTDWEAIDERDDEKVPNSQGFFPIGPECKKKFPPAFIFPIAPGSGRPYHGPTREGLNGAILNQDTFQP